MSSEKITPIGFQSGKQRLTRYATAIVNIATLMGAILFVTWVLGKIIGALHALVFSLAFANTPEQPPRDFPMLGESLITVEVHPTQYSGDTPDTRTLYTVDRNNWGQ